MYSDKNNSAGFYEIIVNMSKGNIMANNISD